ncbi:TrmH family RNA methyltransferase [Chitinophaga sancti]|uniref:TrmH family RNA methyltransferase n=1 Tax=Chitinophaga sancti TaxID=1004 RepID=UPI003F796043
MTPERRERILSVLNRRQAGLTVVLENIEDPHNIAAIMRTCDAVGIQEIFTVSNKPPRVKKWGAKSSSSANKWLTHHKYTDVHECISVLKQRYDKLMTTHLAQNSVSLYDIDFKESVALVFGNEQTGVSKAFLEAADGNFIIPQMGIIRSLNVSVACAVSIYEAMRQKTLAGHYEKRSLPDEQYNTLLEQWGYEEE